MRGDVYQALNVIVMYHPPVFAIGHTLIIGSDRHLVTGPYPQALEYCRGDCNHKGIALLNHAPEHFPTLNNLLQINQSLIRLYIPFLVNPIARSASGIS
jgi:hypothetical protein